MANGFQQCGTCAPQIFQQYHTLRRPLSVAYDLQKIRRIAKIPANVKIPAIAKVEVT
jgi:hypothetical protein